MSSLDEDLVQRVDQLGSTSWSGTTFRYTTARRDPLSGAGARLNGGRWNPPDIFATIYLATPIDACVAELNRLADSQSAAPETLLRAAWKLHTIKVDNVDVLDLRSAEAQAHVGLSMADISDDDRIACQAVGHAAWFLGLQGILAPSASGVGFVLAAFESRVGHKLEVTASEPFTPGLLAALSRPAR